MSENKPDIIEGTMMSQNQNSYATHEDVQFLENKFTTALTDGFSKLEQAINTRTDKIEERVTTLDIQRSNEIAALREKQSNTGKFNPALTISIVSLVWLILFAVAGAFGAVMLKSAVNEESLRHSAVWVEDTKNWIRQNEHRDNVQDVDIQGLRIHSQDVDETISDLDDRIRDLEFKK